MDRRADSSTVSATPDLIVRDVRLLDGRTTDIASSGTVVTAVGRGLEGGGGVELDGRGCLATRPFVDTHLHLDKAGTADRLPGGAPSLMEAILALRSLKAAERDAVAVVATRMATVLRGVVAAGTRVVRAVVDVDETWGLTAFHAATAVRTQFADVCDVRVVAFPQDGLSSAVAALLEVAAMGGADAIGAHTDIDDDKVAHLRTAVAIAAGAGLPLEVHTDEGARPDRFFLPLVLEALDRSTGVDATLVHCLSLATLPSGDQTHWITELAARALPVCIAPTVMILGVPMAPVRRLIEGGVTVVVGSDNLHDVFCPLGTGRAVENARIVAIVGRLTRDDLLAPLVAGVTDAAYATVTGQPGPLQVGSPATFVVHEATTPAELLRGVDRAQLMVTNGCVDRQQEGARP